MSEPLVIIGLIYTAVTAFLLGMLCADFWPEWKMIFAVAFWPVVLPTLIVWAYVAESLPPKPEHPK